MIAFYVPLKFFIIHAGFSNQTIMLIYDFLIFFGYFFLTGTFVGYGLYKHFSYLTKFEKFSFKKHYLSRKRGRDNGRKN